MQELVNELRERLITQLEYIYIDDDPIKEYRYRGHLVMLCIEQLRKYVIDHPFTDKGIEIEYFRYVAPSFYSQYLYFNYLKELAIYRLRSDDSAFASHLKDELKRTDAFFMEHSELFQYYHTDSTNLDSTWFVKGKPEDWSDPAAVLVDDNFCVASYRLSQLIAGEHYRVELLRQLKGSDQIPVIPQSPIRWNGSKADATEFVASIHAAKVIFSDKKPATLAQIIEWFQSTLQVDLKGYTNSDAANRLRKKEAAPLLTKLMAAYLERNDRLLD